MRRYQRRELNNRSFFVICALIAILLAINIVINISLRPVIFDMAREHASVKIYELINDAVYGVMDDENMGYSQFVTLVYNNAGFVTSCEYDYTLVNRIKITCQSKLINELESISSAKLKIPIGNAFGDINAQGKGAKIRVKLQSASVPKIEIISLFETCGINQTKHEIRLRITVDASVYLPPKKSGFSCTQEYVIAQTIIVGDIPEGYAVLG